MYLTELAGAAGLLLVTVLGRCDLGDGLAVGHLGSVELDVLLELVGDSPLDVVDMLLAHTGEDGLAQFLGVFHGDGGILGSDLVEGVAHLGLVVLVHGLDGAAVLGIREDHMLDGFHAVLGEGHIRLAGFKFHHAADVTGGEGSHFFLLGTGHGVDGAEALAVTGLGVHEVCALVEGTAHYLEVGNFTQVLLYGSLEDEDGGGAGRVALEGAAVHGGFFLAFRRRNHVHGEFHEALYANVLLGGGAEHGDGVSLLQAHAETFTDFVGGEFHGFEELLHELVGTLGSLLHEFGAEFFGLVGIGGGDFHFFVLLIIELHGDNVHETFQTGAGSSRELADGGLLAEFLVDGVAHTFPVGLVVVQLVHGDNHRNAVLVCITGEQGGTHLNAGRGVHHHDGGVHNLKGGKSTSGKIVGTGSIDKVDLATVELCVQRGGVDGLLVGLLELGIIGHGVLFFHATAAVNHFSLEKHGLGQGGFTGTGCTDEDDVADVFSSVSFHCIINYFC